MLRVVQGLGFSSFFVANYMHVIELVPVERRGWALGIYGVSGFLGTALAPWPARADHPAGGLHLALPAAVLLAAASAFLVVRTSGIRPPHMGPGPGLSTLREGVLDIMHLHMALAFFFGLGTGVMFTFLADLR